jgi:hypothetical protein
MMARSTTRRRCRPSKAGLTERPAGTLPAGRFFSGSLVGSYQRPVPRSKQWHRLAGGANSIPGEVMVAKKAGTTRARSTTPRKPRRKNAEPRSRGLNAAEVASEATAQPTELIQAIQQEGGQVLSVYRDPLGAHTGGVRAALPIDKVEPTPYQRDLSEPHVKRLVNGAAGSVPGSGDRHAQGRQVLDAQRQSPAERLEAAGRQVHRGAGAARGGRGVPGPRRSRSASLGPTSSWNWTTRWCASSPRSRRRASRAPT